MYKDIYLVVLNSKENDKYEDIVRYIVQTYKITPAILPYTKVLQEGVSYSSSVYMLYLPDDEIKLFLRNNLKYNINISILPTPQCENATTTYGIQTDVYKAIDDGLNESLLSTVDIFECNDIIVFDRAIIGDMHGMNRIDFSQSSIFKKIQIFLHNLKRLKFKNYTLSLSQDKKIQTVAVGITVLEQSVDDKKNKTDQALSIRDGKLSAFILAPTSLLAYLWYLVLIFVYQKISINSLPDGLGNIQSSQLTISSTDPIEFLIDGKLMCAKEVDFIVHKEILNIHLGMASFTQSSILQPTTMQDIIDVKTLPKKELEDVLVGGKLPFFKRASEDEFKDLFTVLRNDAKTSSTFMVLMVLSTLLATTGLFANSAPVIIGAMILAPLMSPIISFSMGIIRTDIPLTNQSIKTLIYGIITAVAFAAFFTTLIPLKEITPEMSSSLHPNLLDLMIAIFSGIAGAYASSKEGIAKSLAGVAIAVALIPPLSVTGVGIGMLDPEIIYGSFLLFITNFVGITLSAAFTFTVLGYSPVHRATKAIVITSIMLIVISIPLYFSFVNLVEKNHYINQLSSLKSVKIDNNKLELKILKINNLKKNLVIKANVLSFKVVTDKELHKLKIILQNKVHRPIVLKVNTEVIVQ